jgi:imidazolonepropionase-like amidohydrolase
MTAQPRNEVRAALTLVALGLAVTASPACTPDARAPSGPVTVYHGFVLIDGTGGPPIREAVLVVVGDTLACAGTATDCARHRSTRGVRAVELADAWVIPGLVDLHFHLSFEEDPDFLPLLRAGVTTVREVGPMAASDAGDYRVGHGQVERLAGLADRLTRREFPGPRLLYCGPQLFSSDQPPPDAPRFIQLGADTDVDAVVDYLVEGGASCIKLVSGTTADHMEQVLTAAAARGVAGIGHSSDRIPLSEQLAWPWAEVHHAWIAPDDFLPPEKSARLPAAPMMRQFAGWALFDADAPEARALAARIAQRRIGWAPTLAAMPFPWGLPPEAVDAMLSAGEAPGDRELLHAALFDPSHPPAAASGDTLEVMSATMARFQRRWTALLHEAGVRILAGSDWELSDPHRLHQELELLVEAGLSPADALGAATRNAALALALEGKLGTLVPGAAADFLVLDADPLSDIRNTRRIRMVIQRGDRIDG